MEKTKKVISIKESYLFSIAYKKGMCYTSHSLAVYILKGKTDTVTRLGITVSKKRGIAVVRNRTKRKIKEAFRLLKPHIKDGYLIVIVAKHACIDNSSAAILEELYALLTKATLFVR